MYKNALRALEDISLFPVLAFIIFFVFFTGLLIYVFVLNKSYVAEVSALPLQDNGPADSPNAHT